MSTPIKLFPDQKDGETFEVVYWSATPSLQWKGRELQQLWQGSNGKQEWRAIPEASEFDPE